MSEHEKVSTPDVIKNLVEFSTKVEGEFKRQADARHDANSKYQHAVMQVGRLQEVHTDRIDQLERSVLAIANDVKDIRNSMSPFGDLKQDFKDFKRRIMGDDALKTEGLISEHNAHEKRLTSIENIANDTRREQRIAIVVIGALASVVLFAKASGLLTWLSIK